MLPELPFSIISVVTTATSMVLSSAALVSGRSRDRVIFTGLLMTPGGRSATTYLLLYLNGVSVITRDERHFNKFVVVTRRVYRLPFIPFRVQD
jgi:hypothetical protein